MTPPSTSTGPRGSACASPVSNPPPRRSRLRLPLALLERIKIEANRRDVPYQSLIKIWLAEKVEQR